MCQEIYIILLYMPFRLVKIPCLHFAVFCINFIPWLVQWTYLMLRAHLMVNASFSFGQGGGRNGRGAPDVGESGALIFDEPWTWEILSIILRNSSMEWRRISLQTCRFWDLDMKRGKIVNPQSQDEENQHTVQESWHIEACAATADLSLVDAEPGDC